MTDHTPTDTNDIDSEEIVMNDVETGFLENRDPEDSPAVLRITSAPKDQHQREALDRLERWEAGEAVPHVINFQNPSDLRALLTDRRVELLTSVMAAQPESIRQLSERLTRDVKSIHDDLQLLAEYDIVHIEQDGRAKRPFVPYETIEVTLEISPPNHADDVAPA